MSESEATCLSHYDIRAQNYREMIDWYSTVFVAKIQHPNEFLAFMTLDDERHRRSSQ